MDKCFVCKGGESMCACACVFLCVCERPYSDESSEAATFHAPALIHIPERGENQLLLELLRRPPVFFIFSSLPPLSSCWEGPSPSSPVTILAMSHTLVISAPTHTLNYPHNIQVPVNIEGFLSLFTSINSSTAHFTSITAQCTNKIQLSHSSSGDKQVRGNTCSHSRRECSRSKPWQAQTLTLTSVSLTDRVFNDSSGGETKSARPPVTYQQQQAHISMRKSSLER